jgi:hypothetical protein
MSKAHFRIDLREPDRTGATPLLYEGRFIGLATGDPLAAASLWLMKHRGAKPGDGIELWQNGVHRSYSLIRAEEDENPYPDEDTGNEPNKGDDESPAKPPKSKKKTKPKADDDEGYTKN